MRSAFPFVAGMLLGATLGASLSASNISATGGSRETLVWAAGDSLLPAYSTNSDTSLFRYASGYVIAKKCGSGLLYMRNWRRRSQATADTITLLCPSPLTTMTNLCDSLLWGFHTANPDTTLNPALYPDAVKLACKSQFSQFLP